MMSRGEMSRNSGPIATAIACVVRATTDRNFASTFENISPIGDRSGLDDGKGMIRDPAASTARTADSAFTSRRRAPTHGLPDLDATILHLAAVALETDGARFGHHEF